MVLTPGRAAFAALARESLSRLPIAADLSGAEVMLLQQLLAPDGDAVGYQDARPLGAQI